MEDRIEVFRRVLRESPGSIRELGRQAEVSERLLRLIRDGKRRFTPHVQGLLVEGLRDWAEKCASLADDLEQAPPEDSTPEGGDDA